MITIFHDCFGHESSYTIGIRYPEYHVSLYSVKAK